MSQRRVNVKAVGVILVVIIGLMGSLVGAKLFLFKKDPRKYISLAEADLKAGRLIDAESNYKIAVDADQKNLDVRVKYGDVLHELAKTDETFAGRDRAVWDGVLTANPTQREALERMLRSEIEIVEFYSDPHAFQRLQEISRKIENLKPDGKDPQESEKIALLKTRARPYSSIATIAGWMAEIVTPPELIDKSTDDLTRLLEIEMKPASALKYELDGKTAKADLIKDPAKKEEAVNAIKKREIEGRITINPDIPYYLGSAYVRKARELRTLPDVKGAKDLEEKAKNLLVEVSHVQPNNAALSLRFYQVLRAVSDAWGDSPDDENKADKQKYVKLMGDLLKDASESVSKDDPACTEVFVNYAQFLLRNKKTEDAETVLRDLIKKRPGDQSARLSLGALIHGNSKTRDEAIELLKKPVTDPGGASVLTVSSKILLEKQTFVDLTNYLIEAYNATTDVAKRASLDKDINENYQKLVERAGVVPATLKLKGKISLMKGGQKGAIEAIPDLERARELIKQTSGARNAHDWEVEFLLATAYNNSNQTGLAKQRLWDIVNGVPSYIPSRLMLIRLLISNRDEMAREQLRDFKKAFPSDPNIPKLEMALYLIEPTTMSPTEIAKVIETMPESTNEEIRRKIPMYLVGGKIDDAIRLFEVIRAKSPADVDTVRTLAQIYMSQQKKDLAIKVTDEALAKDPENISLKIVRAQIDKDQNKIVELTSKAIEAIKEPLDRELKFYEFYSSQNNRAEAMKHLDLAEKADPENGRIMDLRFGLALLDRKFDVAASYVDRLALKDYDEANGLIYKYRLAMVRGNLKEAEDFARELVKTREQFARSWICLGDVLKEEHQFDDAASKYQMALQKQSENLEAFRGLIECNYQLKKPEEAKRFIEAGLRVNPSDSGLAEQKIAWELNYGDPTKALSSREDSAQRNPESLGAQLAYGAAQWQVAQHLELKGKPADAKAFAAKSRDTFTNIIIKWPDDRFAYAYLADIATYSSDFAAGEKALKAFAERDKWKDSVDPSMLLAEYYYRFGKVDLAETNYDVVVDRLKGKTDAVSIDNIRKASSFYTSTRKYDKAFKTLQPYASDRKVVQQMLEILLAENKFTEAEQMLDEQLQANPKDSQLMSTKGFVLLQEKKIPESLAILNAALVENPHNQTALYYRGMIELRKGPESINDAIKDLTAARDTTNDPNSQLSVTTQLQTRMGLAEALRVNGQVDDAVQEISQCLTLQPTNKEIRIKLIEMLSGLVAPRWGEVDRLLADAQKMKEFEKDPDWPRLRSNTLIARNQPEKALDAIREAIRLSQGQPQQTVPLMRDYLNILARLNNYAVLLSECNELLKNPEVAQSAWWVYHMRATAYAKLGNNKPAAMSDFDKALEISGRVRTDDATVLIIQTIADTIGLEEAIARCEREARDGNTHWRVILTYLYFSKKDYVNAEATIEGVLANVAKLTPAEKETAYGVAGSVYMLTGEYIKAESSYSKLLEINPEDTVALNNLACIWAEYLDKPDTTKALVYSHKAMDVMQKRGFPDPNIMDTHGWVLTSNNQMDEGIVYIQAALDRRQMMEAYYHLGVALLKKNLIPEAQQQLDRAHRMLEDRKNKGQPTDAKLEIRLNESLAKAKQLMNAPPATAPVSSGTGDVVKP